MIQLFQQRFRLLPVFCIKTLGTLHPVSLRGSERCAIVAAGVTQGRRVELQGGGLIRSAGGWQAVGVRAEELQRFALE